ncbi:hypothetical protein V8E36_004770 [Tilletia maclaganii]
MERVHGRVAGSTAASSTSTSHRTTASSSTTTLTSAFASLSPADIDFFDNLITSHLPIAQAQRKSGSSTADFASLKAAYESAIRAQRTSEREQPHRWDTLLRLVQVRGRTWQERWDAVRMALGLSPRPSSSSERDSDRAADEDDEDNDASSITESSADTPSGVRRPGSLQQRQQHRQRDMRTEQQRIHPAPRMDSDSPRAHFASPSSQATPTQAANRQRTLDALTARAGTLALAAATSAAATGHPRPAASPQHPRSTAQHQQHRTPQQSSSVSRRDRVPAPYVESAEDIDDNLFATDDDDLQPLSEQYRRDISTRAAVTATARPPTRAANAEGHRPRMNGKAVLADLIRAVRGIALSQSDDPPQSSTSTQLTTRTPQRQGPPSPSPLQSPPQRAQTRTPSLRASHAELSISEPPPEHTHRPRIVSTEHPLLSAHQAHVHSVVTRARLERDRLRHRPERGNEGEGGGVGSGAGGEDAAMVQAADEWGRRVLLIKALSWWVTLTRRSLARSTHVDRVRSSFTLQRSVLHWLARAQARVGVEERAGRIDRLRVLMHAWNTWLERVQERAEKGKEARREAIKGAFREVVGLRNRHLREKFFETWRESYHVRLADAVRREHLQRGALALWSLATSKMSNLHEREDEWHARWASQKRAELWDLWKARMNEKVWAMKREKERKKAALDWWKKAATLNNMATVLERHRLLQSALSAWLRSHDLQTHLQRAQTIAARWHARSLKRRALHAWTHALESQRAREEEAVRFIVELDIRHLREYFVTWTLGERERLLSRVHDGRLLAVVWARWKARKHEIESKYKAEEHALVERVRVGTMRDAWDRLRSGYMLHSALDSAAEGWARKSRLAHALRSWRTLKEQRDQTAARAAQNDAHVLVKGAWDAWVDRQRSRKLQAWEQRKKKGILSFAFASWRSRASLKAAHRLALIRARVHDAEHTQRHYLQRWTRRIITIRASYYDAAEQANARLVESGWQKWKGVLIAHGEMLRLADIFREVKAKDLVARSFDTWWQRAYDSRDREAKETKVSETHRARVLRNAWDAWIDRRADTALRSLEYQAVLVRKQAVLKRAFSRWKQSTQTLPAISFNLAKIKLRALDRWLDKLPLAQNRRLAIQLERDMVLPRFWVAWVQATKDRRNLRAAERFGGISMRKFKSVSGRVRLIGPAPAPVYSSRHAGPSAGPVRVASPHGSLAAPRRWSFGPVRPGEPDDDF